MLRTVHSNCPWQESSSNHNLLIIILFTFFNGLRFLIQSSVHFKNDIVPFLKGDLIKLILGLLPVTVFVGQMKTVLTYSSYTCTCTKYFVCGKNGKNVILS